VCSGWIKPVAQLFPPLPVVLCASESFTSQGFGNRMASFPPLSLLLSLSPRGHNPSAALTTFVQVLRFSSLALQRHLERLAPSRAGSPSLPSHPPRRSSLALQHLQVIQPFFSTPTFDKSAETTLPRTSGGPLPGFVYPLSERF